MCRYSCTIKKDTNVIVNDLHVFSLFTYKLYLNRAAANAKRFVVLFKHNTTDSVKALHNKYCDGFEIIFTLGVTMHTIKYFTNNLKTYELKLLNFRRIYVANESLINVGFERIQKGLSNHLFFL